MTEQTPLNQKNLKVENLGPCNYENPINFPDSFFQQNTKHVIYNNIVDRSSFSEKELLYFERPLPGKKIHFDSKNMNVGLVTCGGLCPGLNDVIRAITLSCLDLYKVKNVFGFRFGYLGLTSKFQDQVISLGPDNVDNIHEQGGTILSSSRGNQDICDMIDTLVKFNISILFTVGGDGTQTGASELVKEIAKRKLDISIIGVPKTIDNDISYVYRTFGFYTAVEEAKKAINSAHVESKGTLNGIGLVKLMGRHSGSIASHATLASGNVNMCLIPETPFSLENIIDRIEKRFKTKDHIVIAVAEGVGQEHLYENTKKNYDTSGNLKLKDIGGYLKEAIPKALKERGIMHSLKYIDPSYMIRSTQANANDSSFCLRLGNNAVHAGMLGKTNIIVGYWNQHFTLTPISLAVSKKKIVDTNSSLWKSVTEITI